MQGLLSRPERGDYYLMQVACEVRRGYARYPRRVKMEDFLLTFKEVETGPPAPEQRKRRTERSKQAWLEAMTAPVKEVFKELKELKEQ